MANITPFDYHDDSANHGDYQYILLKDIIDGFLVRMQDDDHILKNTKRYILLNYAKEGIRELNKEVMKDVLAMEITVPDTLYFALPHDFVDWVRVSVVVTDEIINSFRLQPLDVNNRINTADGYLQDNDASILFDADGYILKADSSNAFNKPYKKYEFTAYSNGSFYDGDGYYNNSGNRTLNTSKLSKWGEFKIDQRRGKIVFSSDLEDQEIVMEYMSDGLSFDTYAEEGEEIRVHKDAVAALKDYIYFNAIEHKKNVSNSEKHRALLRFKTSKHKAKLHRAGFDLLDISRTMRLSSKNI